MTNEVSRARHEFYDVVRCSVHDPVSHELDADFIEDEVDTTGTMTRLLWPTTMACSCCDPFCSAEDSRLSRLFLLGCVWGSGVGGVASFACFLSWGRGVATCCVLGRGLGSGGVTEGHGVGCRMVTSSPMLSSVPVSSSHSWQVSGTALFC